MRLLCSGSRLPYLSNRVQATYTLPRCGEPGERSAATHGLSSVGSAVLTWSMTVAGGSHSMASSDRRTNSPLAARSGAGSRMPASDR